MWSTRQAEGLNACASVKAAKPQCRKTLTNKRHVIKFVLMWKCKRLSKNLYSKYQKWKFSLGVWLMCFFQGLYRCQLLVSKEITDIWTERKLAILQNDVFITLMLKLASLVWLLYVVEQLVSKLYDHVPSSFFFFFYYILYYYSNKSTKSVM